MIRYIGSSVIDMVLSGNNMPVLGNNMALWSEKGRLIDEKKCLRNYEKSCGNIWIIQKYFVTLQL